MSNDEEVHDLLKLYLDRLRAGDTLVYAGLWELVNERLTALTRQMKRRQYQVVGNWELTEDIAQNARIRLIQAMKACMPATPREFYGLANLQIRRELLDTIRHQTGRAGNRAPTLQLSDEIPLEDASFDPEQLGQWLEFHEFVDALPDSDRETVELLWYQGLTQQQAAKVLGVDKSTVKLRWRDIRAKLANVIPHGNRLHE